MRWLYYYPYSPNPLGGLKQVRLAATLLREMGVEVYLLRSGYDPRTSVDDNKFFGVDVPCWPEPFESARSSIRSDDVLLLPEWKLSKTLDSVKDWKCRKAINNQNGFYALRHSPPSRVIRASIEFAVANAPYVATICRDYLGVPENRIFLVPHWVVRAPFDFRPDDRPRRLAIGYMPRKLTDLQTVVRSQVAQVRPDLEWVEIDQMAADQVADTLRRVKLFFAAQSAEGCPLPALEAMTCGAAVVGFGGTTPFPHPYATRQNGWWAKEYVPRDAVRKLLCAISICEAGGDKYTRTVANGRLTAARYSRESVVGALRPLAESVQANNYTQRSAVVESFSLWNRTRTAIMLMKKQWRRLTNGEIA
jgi:hypothetical protein